MIPATVTTALSSLQAQVATAEPLEQASAPTIAALQLNAAALVVLIDIAVANAADDLDTWDAPSAPEGMISGINELVGAGSDQTTLALMRGVCGRAAANLDQLGPMPAVPPAQVFAPLPPPQPPETGITFMAKFQRMRQLRTFRF